MVYISPTFRDHPEEFQRLCLRIFHRINPSRDIRFSSSLQLKKVIVNLMAAQGNYRLMGFLKGGGAELAFERAQAGELIFRRMLGWEKEIRRVVKIVRPGMPGRPTWKLAAQKRRRGVRILELRRLLSETEAGRRMLKPMPKSFWIETGLKPEDYDEQAETKKYWWQNK
jgi:hypothetical protein